MGQAASSASVVPGPGRERQYVRIKLLKEIAWDYWKSRHLAWEMFSRNMAREYRQSLFGILLAFVPALIATAWATAIRHSNILNLPADMPLAYAPFVLISLMLWYTFSDSVVAPISGLQSELPMIARSTMPSEAVMLSQLWMLFFNFLIRGVVILIALWWYAIPFHWMILLSLFPLILLILFGFGIGLFLAPLNVFYRDVSKGLQAVLTFWLFMTPVIVPMPEAGWARFFISLNPVTPLLVSTREMMTFGTLAPLGLSLSHPIGLGIMVFVSIGSFLIGSIFHRAALPMVVDRANV